MDAMGYTYQESIGKTSRLFVLLIATHHPYAYVYIYIHGILEVYTLEVSPTNIVQKK